MDNHSNITVDQISQALRQVFGENVDSQRFIDTTKIPFICKDIEEIRKTQAALKESIDSIPTQFDTLTDKLDARYVNQDQFWPVKTIVYGVASSVMLAVAAALWVLVIK